MEKLGFIGAGVMASAIIDGILNKQNEVGIAPEKIFIFDPIAEKLTRFSKIGLQVAASEAEIFQSSECVILAVKPQNYREILLRNRNNIKADTLVSIMAGVSIATLRRYLPSTVAVIRVMPNMCCRIGKGICAITVSDNIKTERKEEIFRIFSASGDALELDESKFDAVTAVSGSGPAYIFYMAESMVQGGIAAGLTESESKKLALATIEGAAVMARESKESLSALVDRVCSKGGTTIEAIRHFQSHGFKQIIKDGMSACKKRSEELAGELG